VLGAGVLIRLATDQEVRAVERAGYGLDLKLEPMRSHRFTQPDRRLVDGEVYVVSQTFVDFRDGDVEERWVSAEHHGHRVSAVDDATMDLLELVRETEYDGLIDLLGDMGIAGLGVSRWGLMSAPRRIELAPELEARLAPLRRR
jgi:hypothetical protein